MPPGRQVGIPRSDVQAAHALGSLHVDRVFFLVRARLVAADEAEAADLPVQVGQRELHVRLPAVEVMQAEALEIADQDVLRLLGFAQAGEVVGGLVEGGVQVHAGALVLGQHHAGPEQVDASLGGAGETLRLLLVHGHAAALLAEHLEEVVPEALRLGALGGFTVPFRGQRHARGRGSR
ncbi:MULTISPECIES: hypothetical protein [unclassified Luteimonas]|uniref:hypothetical protein n=1 Tax=unclassified Luteimonas TaxID=2629088 RepID=UPI0018F0F056|nr:MULTISPECIES: hypothetical protein [unclassified Luteimonas]MBJ6979835.1 hypothetical protein [Luteimonas sp. MC1895]MBJ6985473.1 hypothetical protein [Luteimonas sp. MC1750]QQO06039.1 hypothetical protein JGR68_00815 [Luteimonas sp. MC1750]